MSLKKKYTTVNRQRRAGVLLHPTSLPGPLPNGDIGHEAYRFIEFLNKSGFKVWQMLPLGPTHDDGSPYQCLSAHAGNPLLISLDWLKDKGWLDTETINKTVEDGTYRASCLQQAGMHFYKMKDDGWEQKIAEFSAQHINWLEDYALFMAFKKHYHDKPWYEWPDDVRHRDANSLADARVKFEGVIKQVMFEQFVFFTQWHEVRDYAKQHQVEMFGDMPIFVARDSADVWAYRKNFLMDSDGAMKFIAGVPPDAFSDTGQRWGNPLYDWECMKLNAFRWWKERFETQLQLFDMVRVDHFRGLQACWQIPEEDDTAINGRWVEVPGRELLSELFESFDLLPLVAEDLGVITDEVIELKEHFDLSGMKVLQFGFDGNNQNPHLPHCHQVDDVVYSGTHDNDTTFGWAKNENNFNKVFLQEYTGLCLTTVEEIAFSIIRMAMSSVSFLCVLPMQDLVMMGSSARMNTPGTIDGNWCWRFTWSDVKPDFLEKISHLMTLYDR